MSEDPIPVCILCGYLSIFGCWCVCVCVCVCVCGSGLAEAL